MPKEEFRCVHQLRVRWAEVDMQKVVFNAHYLTYIDTAIAEYWRAIGLPYPDEYVRLYGTDLFLRKATIEYLGSARYDDRLDVFCRTSRFGRSSMTMRFEIWRHDETTPSPLATAELVYVNVSVASTKSAPLPKELVARVNEYERVAPHLAHDASGPSALADRS